METQVMVTYKGINPKKSVLQIILLYICLAIFLVSCDVTTSCEMQAVAGGSQYCQESLAGE
jgi:hypothetical protein